MLVAGQLPPDPWAVLQSEAMGWILQTLKRDHDLVVVDTPPLPHVADAISLLGQVDGVVVAASANSTRGDDARRLREQLQGLDARVLGVVVNRGSAIGGYGYVPSIGPPRPRAEHRPFTADNPTDPPCAASDRRFLAAGLALRRHSRSRTWNGPVPERPFRAATPLNRCDGKQFGAVRNASPRPGR